MAGGEQAPVSAGGQLPVVVVTGAPATGKSTLGRLLARRLHAALIDQDVATGPLVAVIQRLVGVADLDDERLAGLTRTARYEVMTALAIDNLNAGIPVVLVAPYTAERADHEAWTRLATQFEAAGGTPLLVWLSLEPDEIVRRLRQRNALRDREKLADAGAYLEKLAQRATAPIGTHLLLAAHRPHHEHVQRVIDALK